MEGPPLCNAKQSDDFIIVLWVRKERAGLDGRSARRRHGLRAGFSQDEKRLPWGQTDYFNGFYHIGTPPIIF
jgi:hypothetical protein